jgi:phospholipid/cholesterol/gamma-HCH transport system substrate-binding protein
VFRFFAAGSDRTYRIAVGLVTLLLASSLVVVAVKIRVGGDPRSYYQLNASFTAAGQGLLPGSDVKVRGVDIGRVRNIRLRDGKALVRLDIRKSQKVPQSASATIRPKTLFGEKFVDVDPGTGDGTGPYLGDEGVVTETVGGFELERVLADLYPVLKAVKPQDLAVVLDSLAQAADGKGPQINRLIATYSDVLGAQASNNAELDQYLQELARLSEGLVAVAPAALGLAEDLNQTLPDLNARGPQLTALLDETTRLSGDLDALLKRNTPFIDKAINQGGRTLQELFDDRNQIGPLITGFRQFFQVLSSIGRIPYDETSQLVAIKYVLDPECPFGRLHCGQSMLPDGRIVENKEAEAAKPAATPTRPAALPVPAPAPAAPRPAAPTLTPMPVPGLPGIGGVLPQPSEGAQAIVDLLGTVLGAPR